MGELLTLPEEIIIDKTRKTEIEQTIEETIRVHEANSVMISKLTLDSVTALTASKSRANELAEQGFLKRHWHQLTGKNKKIRAQIDIDIANVQYASQQTIQQLANQNLLTFDLVTAVNNKLNTLVTEVDSEINELYHMLGLFFKQVRSNIVQLDNKIAKVERNVDLLHWNATIEYQLYDGVEYGNLATEEKISCIVNDFLHKTEGNWSTADLMLLKSTLAELGLPIQEMISATAYYRYLIENPSLIERLFAGISLENSPTIDVYEAPVAKGVEKIMKLQTTEQYVLQTVTEQLDQMKVPYNNRDITLSLIHNYLKHKAFMNTEVQLNTFDFVLELLVNLKMINESVPVAPTELAEEHATEEIEHTEDDIDVIQFDKDVFETQSEYEARIANLEATMIGEARIVKEGYDVTTNLLPITIEWKEAYSHMVFSEKNTFVKIAAEKARHMSNQAYPIKAAFGVKNHDLFIVNPVVCIGEEAVPVLGGIPQRKALDLFVTGDASIVSIVLSSDGSRLAAASMEKDASESDYWSVVIWDTVSGEQLHSLGKRPGWILSVAFNEEETELITAHTEDVVEEHWHITHWDLETCTETSQTTTDVELVVFGKLNNSPFCAGIVGDSTNQAESILDVFLQSTEERAPSYSIYKLPQFEQIMEIDHEQFHDIMKVALHNFISSKNLVVANEKTKVAYGNSSDLYVYDALKQQNYELVGEVNNEKPVTFIADGTLLMTEDYLSGQLYVWNVERRQLVKSIEREGYSNRDGYDKVSLLLGNDLFIYAQEELAIFSIAQAKKIGAIVEQDTKFVDAIVSDNGRVIVAIDKAGSIVIYR